MHGSAKLQSNKNNELQLAWQMLHIRQIHKAESLMASTTLGWLIGTVTDALKAEKKELVTIEHK